MATVKSVPVTTVAAENYEPFVFEEAHVGDVHWLRTTGSGEGLLLTGLWKCEPRTIDITYPCDETLFVVEGEARLEIDGTPLDLKPGDILSLAKGQRVLWTITSPFKKFFVDSL